MTAWAWQGGREEGYRGSWADACHYLLRRDGETRAGQGFGSDEKMKAAKGCGLRASWGALLPGAGPRSFWDLD